MKTISFVRTPTITGSVDNLPASKSISNRVIILNALSGNQSRLHNLSDANDTQLMLKRVNAPQQLIDVEDAGTTMRFLTAYFGVTGQHKIITGTPRMKERPIGILADALRSLGVDIVYKEKPGYPPLEIRQFSGQKTDSLRIRGDVSSQFISALMMIAPVLPQGLKLTLEGKVGSKPYIEMTAALMRLFGATCTVGDDQVTIPSQTLRPAEVTVESDWSAASYWFAFTALSEKADITLPRLTTNSLQGDSVVMKIMQSLGVSSTMQGTLMKLTKTQTSPSITWDFTHCPDLAQTVAVVCAVKGVEGHFTGLESLRIKETDRIAALQHELRKINADLLEENGQWKLVPAEKLPPKASFHTYEDHRMAMAFAPLATMMEVEIDNPSVVRKSYPRFWDDMKLVGMR